MVDWRLKHVLKTTSPQLKRAVAYIKSNDVAQYRRTIRWLAQPAQLHGTVAWNGCRGRWRSIALDALKEMTRGVELSDGRSHFRNGCIVIRDAMPRLTPPTNQIRISSVHLPVVNRSSVSYPYICTSCTQLIFLHRSLCKHASRPSGIHACTPRCNLRHHRALHACVP